MEKRDFEREYGVIKDLSNDKNIRGYTNDDKDTIFKSTLHRDGSGVKYDLYDNFIIK